MGEKISFKNLNTEDALKKTMQAGTIKKKKNIIGKNKKKNKKINLN